MPIDRTVTWVRIVGAISGLATLAALGFFTYLSFYDAQAACNGFISLALFFAFGSALAASFIGGAAALEGQLGEGAQQNPFVFSAGGGVAVLFIAILVLWFIQPKDCGIGPQAVLKGIPENFVVSGSEKSWSQQSPSGYRKYDLHLSLRHSAKGELLQFTVVDEESESKNEICHLNLHIVGDLYTIKQISDDTQFKEFSIAEGLVNFLYTGAKYGSGGDKETDPVCFSYNSFPVFGALWVSKNGDKLMLREADRVQRYTSAQLPEPSVSSNLWVRSGSSIQSRLLNFGVSSAFAQEQPMAYEELLRDLKSSKSSLWVEARRYLTDHFEFYQNNIVDEIFASRDASGDFLASLLSALTYGIGMEIGYDPSTNVRQLNLEKPLPFVDGKEARVFQLTGDSSASVRRQARRLIQRYPVDAFEEFFEPLIDAAIDNNCSLNPEVLNAQAQIYASIFYKYNRLIHLYMETDISAEDFAVIESTSTRILGAAENCLTDKSLKVDAAAILYAKWVLMIYADNSPALSDAAVQSAKAFIGFVDANTSDNAQYYIQGHISHVKAWLENN